MPKINNNEIDVKSTETFPVEVICENYIFNLDENFTVTYVREASGNVVTFTTEPESYTNKDEIKILVKISNPKGIKSIQKPGETDRILAQGQTEVGIDYKVTKNGHYIFTIVDEEGHLWTWGCNDYGALGDGTTENKKIPVKIIY